MQTEPYAPRRRRPPPLAALLVPLLIVLGGCSFFQAPSQVRGNKVDGDALKELVPGTSTRADATALIGSPTAKATFDDNTWIYISEITRPRVGRIQGELSQNVVVLSFNDQGVLQTVKTLNQQDALPVAVASGATPSPGSNASIMQQLLGNVGKVTPGGSTPGGIGGGAPGF